MKNLTNNEILIINDIIKEAYAAGLLSVVRHDSHIRKLENDTTRAFAGVTKIVLVSKLLSDWIIKIPFLYEDGYTKKRDYCRLEAHNYERAVLNGLEDYFAGEFFFKYFCGIPIYIQERVDCDPERVSSTLESEGNWDSHCYWRTTNGNTYFDSSAANDMDDEDRLVSIYGENWDLIRFLNDNSINDLHCGNFGITKDNRLIIIDYSGYWG